MIEPRGRRVAPNSRVIALVTPVSSAIDGPQGPGEEVDRERQGDREALGIGEGERLRDELGEDDREQREDDRDDDERDAVGRALVHAERRRAGRSRLVDEADRRRYAEAKNPMKVRPSWDDREEPARVVEQPTDAPGARAALVDELLDAAPADRDEGDLGGDEEAFEERQEDDDEELDRRVRSWPAARLIGLGGRRRRPAVAGFLARLADPGRDPDGELAGRDVLRHDRARRRSGCRRRASPAPGASCRRRGRPARRSSSGAWPSRRSSR